MTKEHVIYNGEKYWLQTTGRYYQNGNRQAKPRLLHRKIWVDHYGEIPEDHVIHHKDHDWRNNNISNLEAVPRRKHASEHSIEARQDPEYVRKTMIGLDKAREAAKKWHKSKEGHKWHKQHAKEGWKDKKIYKIICSICNKEKITPFPTRTRFCSVYCSRAGKYESYKTEMRKCVECDKEFITNRHREIKTCSRSCGAKMRWKKNE